MSNQPLYIRKLIHVVWGVIVLGILYYVPYSYAIGLFLFWAAGMTLADGLRLKWKPWQQVFRRWFGPLLKDWEQQHFPTGATVLVYTALIVSLLFNSHIAGVAIAILIFADALAAVFGQWFPILRFPNGKSFTGSMTFFLVALGLCSHYFTTLGSRALAVAILLTLVELASPPIIENLGIGLGSALLLQWFSS